MVTAHSLSKRYSRDEAKTGQLLDYEEIVGYMYSIYLLFFFFFHD